MDTSSRSLLVTILGWLVIIVGAALSVISVITAMMFFVGSYGTKNANALDALITIAGPPLMLFAGIGLLRRKRIAWFTLVAMLIALLGWQASEFLKPPAAENTTFIAGPRHSMPVIAVCSAALAILFLSKSRGEFAAVAARKVEAPASAAPHAPSRGELDAAEEREIARGWRLGHRGRDQMFYEERRDGKWECIAVDGEMLMGRTHHVIYFASAETWQSYPEWARLRRDEIIARIKSQFREPEYEYSDGGTASASPAPAPAVAKAMTSSEFRAVLAFVAIFLGIAALMSWLVVTGLQRDETYWPAKRASQQRVIVREKEPAMFWTSIGVYSGIGLGALAFSICIVRWSRK